MAPETAGSGAALEWQSVEAAPEPQESSAHSLLEKSDSLASPPPLPLIQGFLRAHVRAAHTLSCAPMITDFLARTHSHSQRGCTGCRVHAGSQTLQRRCGAFGCPLHCTQVQLCLSGGSANRSFVSGAVPPGANQGGR